MGNCGTTYGGLTGKTKEDFGHGNARFIPYTNVFDNPLTDTKRLGAVEIDSSQNQVAYGDAFFTVSSETPDEVGMSSVWLSDQEDVYLNSFCFGYRQDSTFDPHYLAYMLRSRSVRSNLTLLAQGISRFNISKNKVMELSVPVPSAVEQEQLGQYFTKLDSLITLHQRECGKPPFNQSPAWEQRKFSDMYVVNNERNVNCELGYDRTLSIATMTFNGGNGAADDSLSNYKVIRVGDIAFEGHTNKVHAYGRFVLNDAGDGLMSPRFSCLRPIVEQRYSFWKYYIPREESMRPILVNATKNGTMMNELVPDDLMHESILVPCLAEQEVIGNSFSQLDHVITLHQRMCPIFSFCAHGSRTNFAQTLQGWLQILRYPRPIPKMLVSPSAPASGVFGTAKGAFICASSSAGASTSSPSARKNFITSSTLCCRESLSSP